jgi:hypothetical protein
LVSSVLVTVPSDAWVTVFSFDLTVPSLLVLVVVVLETSRSHATSRSDNVKADIPRQITVIRFFIMFLHSLFDNLASGVAVVFTIGEVVSSPFLLVITILFLYVGFSFVAVT